MPRQIIIDESEYKQLKRRIGIMPDEYAKELQKLFGYAVAYLTDEQLRKVRLVAENDGWEIGVTVDHRNDPPIQAWLKKKKL